MTASSPPVIVGVRVCAEVVIAEEVIVYFFQNTEPPERVTAFLIELRKVDIRILDNFV
jgi:hypothetical protein